LKRLLSYLGDAAADAASFAEQARQDAQRHKARDAAEDAAEAGEGSAAGAAPGAADAPAGNGGAAQPMEVRCSLLYIVWHSFHNVVAVGVDRLIV
jgi:hypothetical protein